MSDPGNDTSEIFETLENLEQSIIEYEDSLKEEQEDTSLIHIIFRYAHNLKSTLAMARKERSSELIHAVESRFDGIRAGKERSSSDLIDRSLRAIDVIKLNLEQDFEDEEELASLKEEVEALEGAGAVGEEEAKVDFSLTPQQRKKAEEAVKAGNALFQIEKLITSDIDEKSFLELPIYQDVADVGDLIAVYPQYEGINRKGEETTVKLLFSSAESADELYFAIFDPFKKVVLPGEEKEKSTKEPPPAEEGEGTSPPEISGTTTAAHTGAGTQTKGPKASDAALEEALTAPQKMKGKGNLSILIVEDDFVTRHLEVGLLSAFGECEVAVNGKEALKAFEVKMMSGTPYNLVLLDIMIPEIDGIDVLRGIREFETEQGNVGLGRTRVVIVSNRRDMETISQSFRDQSDAYIIKPVTRKKMENHLRKLGLLD